MGKELKYGHVYGRVHAVREDRIVLENGRLKGSYVHVFVNKETNPTALKEYEGKINTNARFSVEKKDDKMWLRPPFDPKDFVKMARK